MKDSKDIRLGQVTKLVVQPGEVLVIKSRKPLPLDERDVVARWFQRNLPGVSFIFLDESITLKVVKAEKKK